jgi:UDP-GlcNAc:undecaprenyl-phosphate GlcNAc-1-phosphate transferase
MALVAALGGAALSVLLTPAWTAVAWRLGLIDSPRLGKIHLRPTPTGGGVVLFVAFFGPLWGVGLREGSLPPPELQALGGLTLAALLMVGLGLWDDRHGLGATPKLLVQVLVGLVIFGAGFRVERLTNPFGADVVLGALALPCTLLWVLAVVNGMNLIDGLDGLAAGIGLVAALTMATVGFFQQEPLVLLLAGLLAGCLVGFLPFNFPPARLFLGDTGSLLVGLLLAVIGLVQHRKATLAMTLVVPIVALVVPLLDTGLAIVRRLRRGIHPFRGDTHHLHHRLLQLGLTPRGAILLLWAASVYGGALALLLSFLPKRHALGGVVLAAVAVYALLDGLRRLEGRATRAQSSGARPRAGERGARRHP